MLRQCQFYFIDPKNCQLIYMQSSAISLQKCVKYSKTIPPVCQKSLRPYPYEKLGDLVYSEDPLDRLGEFV